MKNPKAQHTMYVENRQDKWKKVSKAGKVVDGVDHVIKALENALAHARKNKEEAESLQHDISKDYEDSK